MFFVSLTSPEGEPEPASVSSNEKKILPGGRVGANVGKDRLSQILGSITWEYVEPQLFYEEFSGTSPKSG